MRPAERAAAGVPGLVGEGDERAVAEDGDFGVVQRSVFGDKPPVEVDYVLTPFGRRFIELLDGVRRLQEAVDNGSIADER